MTEIRCRLAWFLAKHKRLWINEAECVDDDFAFDGLYRIDNDRYGARCELFKGLLGVYIDGR